MLVVQSHIEKLLLSYYFLNTEAKMYLHEMARKFGVNPGNLDKKLKQLEHEGVFISEFQGKQKYYSLNKHFPLYSEYQSIFQKTYGIPDQIKEKLGELSFVQKALIFGSYAQKRFDVHSDIDLLIVGEFDTIALSKILHELETKFDREINPVIMDEEEFNKKRREKNEFLDKIFNSPYIEII